MKKFFSPRVRKGIALSLLFLWTLFIFSNSLQDGTSSGEQSGRVLGLILPIFRWLKLPVPEQTLSLIIRKTAHFTEFFILGIFALLIVSDFKEKLPQKFQPILYTFSASYCLLIASLDETIQFFVPGRAASIIDVGIDFAGATCGILLIWFISHRKTHKKDR